MCVLEQATKISGDIGSVEDLLMSSAAKMAGGVDRWVLGVDDPALVWNKHCVVLCR